MALDQYHLLGRSGLRVSRFALGTMTFGKTGAWGPTWGADEEASRAVFDRYLGAGGNFVDTADLYTGTGAESMIGKFLAERGDRERIVLATKYSYSQAAGDPNAAGNGRKHMVRALEASLKRLRTDYVDLYLVHTWDRVTPAEEVVRGLDDLVRAGKIRYAGLSDVPAWYAARAQTYAEAHALSPLVNLQLPYSLIERNLEPEYVALGQTLGMGLTAWSPLGMGMLSGKYKPGQEQGGRLDAATGAALGMFSERNWKIVGVLAEVARQLDRSMAQVALRWVVDRPGVASVILGATRLSQLEDNLGALDFDMPAELTRQLNEASAPPVTHPYAMFQDAYQKDHLHGGASVIDKPPGYFARG